MYFKRAKQRYQLIRTEYDPVRKRGRQILLGSVCAVNPNIASVDLSKLTEAEKDELNAFMVKLDAERTPERLSRFLAELESFQAYLETANDPAALSDNDEMRKIDVGLKRLASTMRNRHVKSDLLRDIRLPTSYDQKIAEMKQDGLTLRQIAEKLSTSYWTVRHRYRKGRQQPAA